MESRDRGINRSTVFCARIYAAKALDGMTRCTLIRRKQANCFPAYPARVGSGQRPVRLSGVQLHFTINRVDYSWKTPAFDVSSGGSYAWDSATLSWKGTEGNPVVVNQSDATLKFTNRSSVPVKVSAVFNVVGDYIDILPNGANFTNNNCTIDSVVVQATKQVDLTRENVQTITASLPLVESQLSQLKLGKHQEFGTFVVTIE